MLSIYRHTAHKRDLERTRTQTYRTTTGQCFTDNMKQPWQEHRVSALAQQLPDHARFSVYSIDRTHQRPCIIIDSSSHTKHLARLGPTFSSYEQTVDLKWLSSLVVYACPSHIKNSIVSFSCPMLYLLPVRDAICKHIYDQCQPPIPAQRLQNYIKGSQHMSKGAVNLLSCLVPVHPVS